MTNNHVILLDLLGGIALLLWGMHMVESGIMRAYGTDLRRFLATALRNRRRAFLLGLGITTVLQSSTATALMVSSFTATGLMSLASALAVMLGANVGTTIIVQILSWDVTVVAPLLIAIGVFAFKRGERTRVRDLGRVIIGLGLMLLSLHILMDSLASAENAPSMHALLSDITKQPLMNLALGAILAWASHSSVAVVLLVMSLAHSGVVTPEAAIALVLGANLGSAINPLIEGMGSADSSKRRLPVGNLINRIAGCVLVLPLLRPIATAMSRIDPDPARQIANFHSLFNLTLALLFIGLLEPFARLLVKLMPEKSQPLDPATPLYLDATAISTPAVALTCAARETLHMGDLVETMLRKSMTALLEDDRRLVTEVEQMDNAIDKLHEAIKHYVTQITRDSLDTRDGLRAMEIISFSINLEHVGDIIDKNLMELAAKKIRYHLAFSREGAAELEAFHRSVIDSLRLAMTVFMSGDVATARRLLEEKVAVREAERKAADNHLGRLREGKPETIETSSLHLDILRDFKRIHSHICSVAYPVLENTGALKKSRLKELETEAEAHRSADNSG